jgi:hypothetical protein
MSSRTIHPLPKRPTFASVPSSSNTTAQRSSNHQLQQQQQNQGHVSQSLSHPPGTKGVSEASSISPALSSTSNLPSSAVALPKPQTPPQVQQPIPYKPVSLPPLLSGKTSLLGSKITLDSSFHVSYATYTGTSLACERFREYVLSTWQDDSDVLCRYLFDFGHTDGQISLFKYEDIINDAEDLTQFGLTLSECLLCCILLRVADSTTISIIIGTSTLGPTLRYSSSRLSSCCARTHNFRDVPCFIAANCVWPENGQIFCRFFHLPSKEIFNR